MEELDNCQINYIENTDDVAAFMRWMGERRSWLACDTETGGLSPYKHALRLIQFGDLDSGWAMRWDRWAGVALEALRKYDGPVVMQNAKFDQQFIELNAGERVFDWSRLHDTRVMAHLLQPNKSTSLKSLGSVFLSPQAKKLQNALSVSMDKNNWGWGDIPMDWPIYWGYGVVDTILTARIAEKFWPKIESTYLDVYELEMASQRVCSNMEVRGFKIDLRYCEEMFEKLTTYCHDLERYCLENWEIRPSENQAVGQKLQKLGIEMSNKTPTGEIAVGKQHLEPVDHPLARSVLEYRKKSKILNSYFKNFLEMHVNGILHCSINILGARTGRMSIQNPALQTLPRGSVVRDAFIPRDGFKLLSCDYDAVEMRLLAHFCQDPGMIQAILSGDIHTEMARLIYQDPEINNKDPRRQVTKNTNFCKAYGGGKAKIALTAGISEEEAEAFLAIYDSRFPGVTDFQNEIVRTGKARHQQDGQAWVKTPLGRLQVADSRDKSYTLIDHLIQGTAADIFKRGLVNLDQAGYEDYLLLPVHDETLSEVPEDDAEYHMKQIEEIMSFSDWEVPITASCEGPFERWGDKARGKEWIRTGNQGGNNPLLPERLKK